MKLRVDVAYGTWRIRQCALELLINLPHCECMNCHGQDETCMNCRSSQAPDFRQGQSEDCPRGLSSEPTASDLDVESTGPDTVVLTDFSEPEITRPSGSEPSGSEPEFTGSETEEWGDW